MSLAEPTNQTIELPARIALALSAIGYRVVMPPIIESPCEDCDGQGYDPRLDGFETCPICQGWRVCRRLVVEVSPGNTGKG